MAGGEVGSSRRRRKPKTKAAASNSEATNPEGFSCNLCGAAYGSSHALGLHQKIHRSEVAKDKAEVSDDGPYSGGGVGSSRRRKAKTKAAAPNSEATNVKGLSCNLCGKEFNSSQDLGEHQKIHKFRVAKDKAEVSDDVPYSGDHKCPRGRRIECLLPTEGKAMEKLPEEISNKYCRICRQPADHWTIHCPNQGQATIAGGGVQSSRPSEPQPKLCYFSETKSRLAKDKLNLVPEVLESNDVVTYPGSRIPQPKGPVTFSQLIEIRDALEKENSLHWQILTKKEDTCFMCGLKMGKDCNHFNEDGVFKVPNCAFCGTFEDHWSHHCPKYSNETYWAAYQESGKIPWGLYKETETKTKTKDTA